MVIPMPDRRMRLSLDDESGAAAAANVASFNALTASDPDNINSTAAPVPKEVNQAFNTAFNDLDTALRICGGTVTQLRSIFKESIETCTSREECSNIVERTIAQIKSANDVVIDHLRRAELQLRVKSSQQFPNLFLPLPSIAPALRNEEGSTSPSSSTSSSSQQLLPTLSTTTTTNRIRLEEPLEENVTCTTNVSNGNSNQLIGAKRHAETPRSDVESKKKRKNLSPPPPPRSSQNTSPRKNYTQLAQQRQNLSMVKCDVCHSLVPRESFNSHRRQHPETDECGTYPMVCDNRGDVIIHATVSNGDTTNKSSCKRSTNAESDEENWEVVSEAQDGLNSQDSLSEEEHTSHLSLSAIPPSSTTQESSNVFDSSLGILDTSTNRIEKGEPSANINPTASSSPVHVPDPSSHVDDDIIRNNSTRVVNETVGEPAVLEPELAHEAPIGSPVEQLSALKIEDDAEALEAVKSIDPFGSGLSIASLRRNSNEVQLVDDEQAGSSRKNQALPPIQESDGSSPERMEPPSPPPRGLSDLSDLSDLDFDSHDEDENNNEKVESDDIIYVSDDIDRFIDKCVDENEMPENEQVQVAEHVEDKDGDVDPAGATPAIESTTTTPTSTSGANTTTQYDDPKLKRLPITLLRQLDIIVITEIEARGMVVCPPKEDDEDEDVESVHDINESQQVEKEKLRGGRTTVDKELLAAIRRLENDGSKKNNKNNNNSKKPLPKANKDVGVVYQNQSNSAKVQERKRKPSLEDVDSDSDWSGLASESDEDEEEKLIRNRLRVQMNTSAIPPIPMPPNDPLLDSLTSDELNGDYNSQLFDELSSSDDDDMEHDGGADADGEDELEIKVEDEDEDEARAAVLKSSLKKKKKENVMPRNNNVPKFQSTPRPKRFPLPEQRPIHLTDSEEEEEEVSAAAKPVKESRKVTPLKIKLNSGNNSNRSNNNKSLLPSLPNQVKPGVRIVEVGDSDNSDDDKDSNDSDSSTSSSDTATATSRRKKPTKHKVVRSSSNSDSESVEVVQQSSSKHPVGNNNNHNNVRRKIVNDQPSSAVVSDDEDEEVIRQPQRIGRRQTRISSEHSVIETDLDADVTDLDAESSSISDVDGDDSSSEPVTHNQDLEVDNNDKNSLYDETSGRKESTNASNDDDDVVELPYHSSRSMYRRKNIRPIMPDQELRPETLEAQRQEKARLKRVQEYEKKLESISSRRSAAASKVESGPSTPIPFKMQDVVHDEPGLELETDLTSGQPLVQVHHGIAKHLKSHQKDGIKFMWRAAFENVEQSLQSDGSGGILAHCMGLGKTIQVIGLIHTVLTNPQLKTKFKTVLVVFPKLIAGNWKKEIKDWQKDIPPAYRVPTFVLSKNKRQERIQNLEQWMSQGGIGLIHYDLFLRFFTNSPEIMDQIKHHKKPKPPSANPRIHKEITAEELALFKSHLLDPGPDVLILDEGHILKNAKTVKYQLIKLIKTKRKIILTGTPLQNNLQEFYSMMEIVKPSLLGTPQEFSNRFEIPIRNGQHADSSPADIRKMKERIHVLIQSVSGCVHRVPASVLAQDLKKGKVEVAIGINLTPLQIKLHNYYLDQPNIRCERHLLRDFSNITKIIAHPKLLTKLSCAEKKNLKKKKKPMDLDEVSDVFDGGSDDDDFGNSSVIGKWFEPVFQETTENLSDFELSGKLIILRRILELCEGVGDKVLVFSQFLNSLDMIEQLLLDMNAKYEDKDYEDSNGGLLLAPKSASSHNADGDEEGGSRKSRWEYGIDYIRLDGSTHVKERETYIKKFNREKSVKLFLLCTKAGSLGINLIGANRVVVFDASWNPSHDLQGIFRVYRYGQEKQCFIYRLLGRHTMEDKIYNNQIIKLALAYRVVDEKEIENCIPEDQIRKLYESYPEGDDDEVEADNSYSQLCENDRVLSTIVAEHRQFIHSIREHDSLLQDDEKLTEDEKRQAEENFKKDLADEGTKRHNTQSHDGGDPSSGHGPIAGPSGTQKPKRGPRKPRTKKPPKTPKTGLQQTPKIDESMWQNLEKHLYNTGKYSQLQIQEMMAEARAKGKKANEAHFVANNESYPVLERFRAGHLFQVLKAELEHKFKFTNLNLGRFFGPIQVPDINFVQQAPPDSVPTANLFPGGNGLLNGILNLNFNNNVFELGGGVGGGGVGNNNNNNNNAALIRQQVEAWQEQSSQSQNQQNSQSQSLLLGNGNNLNSGGGGRGPSSDIYSFRSSNS